MCVCVCLCVSQTCTRSELSHGRTPQYRVSHALSCSVVSVWPKHDLMVQALLPRGKAVVPELPDPELLVVRSLATWTGRDTRCSRTQAHRRKDVLKSRTAVRKRVSPAPFRNAA